MMPDDYGPMLARIAVLERKLAALETRSRPNQDLSTTSNVTFGSMLSGLRGTWAPDFRGSGTAGVFTYTNQQGYFFVISTIVYLFARVTISAIGTPPVGTMRIGGLPYPCHATYFGAATFGYISQFNYAAGAIELLGTVSIGTSFIQLRESFDNAASVDTPAANFTNVATDLVFTGMYQGA